MEHATSGAFTLAGNPGATPLWTSMTGLLPAIVDPWTKTDAVMIEKASVVDEKYRSNSDMVIDGNGGQKLPTGGGLACFEIRLFKIDSNTAQRRSPAAVIRIGTGGSKT